MTRRVLLAGLAVGLSTAAFAPPVASAAINPSLTLDQSAGTTAGSTVNIGTDLKFAPTGSDSPKDLTLSLPTGLLANASIDGGACLDKTAAVAACQVGSGTATAAPVVAGIPTVSVSIPISFYLVAPPKAADLAGLLIQATFLGQTSQLGTPGDITVRASSDPRGVGLNISFTNIPDTYAVLGAVPTQIAVDELDATFEGLRLPTSCPATPAPMTVTADSYNEATAQTAQAPLHVSDCATLPYTPAFHATAARDAADSGVQITTEITQPASPAQSTSRTVALTLPPSVVSPNVAAVLGGGILCSDPSSGTCKTIGTATSTSPLYPTPLTGKDYLTGTLSAPAIAIVFPAPFALTLRGSVDLATSTTTFNNVPDIPLTDLTVSLAGGPDAAFESSCATPSGTATSTLTSQNGDRTVVVSTPFTVAGCPGSGGTTPGTTPTSSKPSTGQSHHSASGSIGALSLTGLARGRPTISFKLAASDGIRSFTIKLPRGLGFVKRHHKLTGVSVKGAKIKSLALHHGQLVVTLRHAVTNLTVTVHAQALKESAGLRHEAQKHHIPSLKLTVTVVGATGQTTTMTQRLKS